MQSVTESKPVAGVGRRIQTILVVLICLLTAVVFRVFHDRKQADDQLRYSDSEEATDAYSHILAQTPATGRLALAEKYLNSDSPGLRYAAVDSLENMSSPKIPDMLEAAFRDSSAEVRKRALDEMPRFDRERAYRIDLEALKDGDSWLRDHAMFLIQSNVHEKQPYVDGRAMTELIGTLNDSDLYLAPLAIPVMKRLTGVEGKEWRFSLLDRPEVRKAAVDRWLGWWSANKQRFPAGNLAGIVAVAPTRSDPAPDFLVKDVEDKRIGLSDLRGKVVLLNFWGTWCGPCIHEIPDLVRLDQHYRDKGLVTVGVAVREKSAAALIDWCKKHGVSYSQILDSEHIAHIYGDCFEVPVSVLIDKQGNVRRRWDGERDYETFSSAVESLLN